MTLERIQKILAKAGIASRREAERMLVEGRVAVNGKVVDTMGFKADPSRDHIKIDGKRIAHFESKVTVLLNKPRGYVSTVEDPQGRPTVIDLCRKVKGRIYPVGRLDFDAEGLLVLTNDGELANILTHPRFSIPRTYLAKVVGVPEERELGRLKRGVMLDDGRARAVSLSVLRHGAKNSWVRVVVTEGRNRLVKRMFAAIGHPVLKLKRTAFGPLQVRDLPIGQFRFLTSEEIMKLKAEKVASSESGVRRTGKKFGDKRHT